jgi:hypothetical protein
MTPMMMLKIARMSLAAVCLCLVACDSMPRDQYVQWAARDQWDASCAKEAIVEQWSVSGGELSASTSDGKRFTANVSAKFKLVNACVSTKENGKAYKQFETVAFDGPVVLVPCKSGGDEGWGLAGGRCWTGATRVGQ